MIKREGKAFYLEVFNPRHEWKYMGKVVTICIPDAVECFVTHTKIPGKHFYVNGHGYPINSELLNMLSTARIGYIMIPENGKRRFTVYIVETEKYLIGEEISEPMTERQRSLPLSELTVFDLDESGIERLLRS